MALEMHRCVPSGCLWNMIASTYVDMYHAAGLFVNQTHVMEENEVLQMSAIKSDLHNCMNQLNAKEADLSDKIASLTTEAKCRQARKDVLGAKRKLIERRRCNEQLQRVTNSIGIMDAHMGALEGTELNKSILSTIRASGDAIQRLSVKVSSKFSSKITEIGPPIH
jgi:hypothetical protein